MVRRAHRCHKMLIKLNWFIVFSHISLKILTQRRGNKYFHHSKDKMKMLMLMANKYEIN